VLIPPDAEIADAELGADVVEIVDAQSPYDAGEQPDVGPGEDAEVPPAEVDAATHVPRYYLGGCGCSAAGSGLPMLALLALALAGPRRRRR
jgi:MYXO-CTERM domain-containing protein